MATDRTHRAGSFEAEGSAPAGLFADEEDFDRRSLFRLASWGVLAVGAVAAAFYTSQSSIGWSREQVAAADLARHEQQIQSIARQGQNEARRLASAIDTLNGDRDRLYSRVSVLEQGLESVTGTIARQKAAVSAAPPAAAPAPGAVATSAPAVLPEPPQPAAAPATTVAGLPDRSAEKPVEETGPARPRATAPLSAEGTPSEPAPSAQAVATPPPAPPETSSEAPPDPVTTAPAPAAATAVAATEQPDTAKAEGTAPPRVQVKRTEFAVEVGGANTLGGLRALWRGLLKSRSNAPLAALHPIIIIKENSTGGGMQLRLGAGPLGNAAAAARICAIMLENHRPCETTVYDGQRLELNGEDASASSAAKPASPRPAAHRRSYARRAPVEEAPAPSPSPSPPPPPPPPEATSLSTIFGRH